MSFEQEPGQSLEQQAGALDDPTVPERAGAIVSEVITSIADETRARAEALRSTAETDAKAQVEAARDASGKVVSCFDDLADKLGELRSDIQQEEGLLSNSLGQLGRGRVAPEIAPAPPPARRRGRRRTEARAEPVVDAEVVEDEAPDETAAAPDAAEQTATAAGETEAPPEIAVPEEAAQTIVLQPDEAVPSELARMNDTELSHTYVDALRLAHERAQAGMDAAQANAVVEAVLDEARTRPGFTEAGAPTRGFRARVASVAGRRIATPKERLREAVRERQPGA